LELLIEESNHWLDKNMKWKWCVVTKKRDNDHHYLFELEKLDAMGVHTGDSIHRVATGTKL